MIVPSDGLTPNLARMKHDLAALVAIRSENPGGREAEAAQMLDGLLTEAGFTVSQDGFAPGRPNIVATLSNGPGPVFAFNTHMDVVPAGGGWSNDPFVLRERDGKLYGRGACDAKGPLIAMVEALRMLAADCSSWRGTLLGVFVADEEATSAGAKYLAATKPMIDFAVIGEPTENGTVTAHKGSLRPLIRVHGITAHSGTPHLGENAIFRAAQFLPLVNAFSETVVSRRIHPLVGNASLTVTRIHGGEADNVIPDCCDVLLDRRMIPGEDEAAVKLEVEQLQQQAADRFGIRTSLVEYRATTGGATETAVTEPIVVASLAASRRHGASGEASGFQGACDLVHFNSIGAKGVIIGPGSLAVAHKPDEFVPVDAFEAASLIYRDVALAMLRTG
jgi:acetylornithine deacetylase/succinyl-diaminopimelate desuccinylase family protein